MHDVSHPPFSSADDSSLVAAVVEGHESALAEIYQRHAPAVSGHAKRILGDAALAEDITQEVFVQLWQHPERFDPTRGKLRTMLLTQAHGKSVDVIRARNARDRREDRVTQDAPPPTPEIDAELIVLTEAELVNRAIAELPEQERAAIELAYFGANTYRQVAVLLDLPEGTVKTRIRTGLRRLHTLLSADLDPKDMKWQPS